MKTKRYSSPFFGLTVVLLTTFLLGCGEITSATSPTSATSAIGTVSVPINISFVPANGATSVVRNSSIVATFSGLLGIETIKNASFTVRDADNNVLGGDLTIDESSKTISFKTTDLNGLLANTEYTVTVTALVNGVNKAHVSSFTTSDESDNLAPGVSSFSPANNSTGIPVNQSIIAVFSESILPSTVNSGSFTLSSLEDGAVSYSETDKQATFKREFDLDLEPNTTYTATITKDVKDLAGNALENSVSWIFTTGTITSVEPIDGAESVPTNSQVVAFFSEPLDPNDDLTFTIKGENNPDVIVGGSVSVYDPESMSVSFTVNGFFDTNTVYTATIRTGTAPSFTNDYVWSFKTGFVGDTDPPMVLDTTPEPDDQAAPFNRIISALFNELLDPSTVSANSFKVTTTGLNDEDMEAPVAGTVSYDNKLISFQPNADLEKVTHYQVTITTDVKDLAGNFLVATTDSIDATDVGHFWSFKTGAAAMGPAPPSLRGVEGFTVLTKAGLTNTGTHRTMITGDIGSSPITASAMNDMYCDEMNGGLIFGVDGSYTGGTGGTVCSRGGAEDKTKVDKAIIDLEAAYTEAAGNAEAVIAEYGAGTIPRIFEGEPEALPPGLYKWGTNVVMNADITLQGGIEDNGEFVGGQNDVWIFQISGNFSQMHDTDMILAGDAEANNVYWQLTENMAIGGGAHLKGNVLAKTHIALDLKAEVTGRLLSQTQITFHENTIRPPP